VLFIDENTMPASAATLPRSPQRGRSAGGEDVFYIGPE
jgi:hypothetical protein